jgi:hypothetical protein
MVFQHGASEKRCPGFAEQHVTGPVGEDDQKDTNRWGAGEKAGMRLRWDAAHNYMKPHVVRSTFKDLDPDDKAAVAFAHKMSGKQNELASLIKEGGEHDWLIHPWLRPAQQRFYLQGLYAYEKTDSKHLRIQIIDSVQKREKKTCKLLVTKSLE